MTIQFKITCLFHFQLGPRMTRDPTRFNNVGHTTDITQVQIRYTRNIVIIRKRLDHHTALQFNTEQPDISTASGEN